MNLAAFLPLSLCDYPGKVAAVVFTQGCNFNCPWCHNRHLIPMEASAEAVHSEDGVIDAIAARRKVLGGVVVSGGEPTVQPDLPQFLMRLKECGLAVKLDTNGSNPDMVVRCIADNLVDFIAMDVKAPWAKYDALTGVHGYADAVRRTLGVIAASGLAHQFRTTRVTTQMDEADFAAIAAAIPAGSPHVWQDYIPPMSTARRRCPDPDTAK